MSSARGPLLAIVAEQLHQASAGLMLLGDRALAPLQLTATQWKVLALVSARGPQRIRDLQAALRLDQGGASRLVQRLQRAGHVGTVRDPTDARAVRVALTAQGAATAAECRRVLGPLLSGLAAQLDDDALAALAHGLHALAYAVGERLEEGGGAPTPPLDVTGP